MGLLGCCLGWLGLLDLDFWLVWGLLAVVVGWLVRFAAIWVVVLLIVLGIVGCGVWAVVVDVWLEVLFGEWLVWWLLFGWLLVCIVVFVVYFVG